MAGKKYRHSEHAGIDERLEVNARRQAAVGKGGQPGTEHEKEKHRLDRPG
jgi:hypothetical protein